MKFLILLYLFNSFNDATMMFLTIYPGTRQVGLGNSGVALAGDVSGIYYNPALSAFIKEPQICQMNLKFPNFLKSMGVFIFESIKQENIPENPNWLPSLWPGMRYEWVGGVLPTKYGSFGITYTYITTGITEASDEQGNIIASWRSYDYSLGFSYAYGIKNSSGTCASFGITTKYVYSFLAPDWLVKELYPETGGGGSAWTIALDAGFFSSLLFEAINFGISIENIGKGVKFVKKEEKRDPIPKLWRRGFSIKPLNLLNIFDTTFTTFFNYTFNYEECTDMIGKSHETLRGYGHEFKFFKYFYIRTGKFEDKKGERVGNTFGMGINTEIFDISYADDSEIYSFGTKNYRVSLTVKSFAYEKMPFGVDIALDLFYPGLGLFSNGKIEGIFYAGLATLFSTLYTNTDSKDIRKIMTALYMLTNLSSFSHLFVLKYRLKL